MTVPSLKHTSEQKRPPVPLIIFTEFRPSKKSGLVGAVGTRPLRKCSFTFQALPQNGLVPVRYGKIAHLMEDILISINNYSHDAAAAFLAVSLAVLWILSRNFPSSGDPALDVSFVRVYSGVARTARYSLFWLLIASIPRAIFFRDYGSSWVMVIKYGGMVFLAGTGLLYWGRLSKKTGRLRSKHNIDG